MPAPQLDRLLQVGKSAVTSMPITGMSVTISAMRHCAKSRPPSTIAEREGLLSDTTVCERSGRYWSTVCGLSDDSTLGKISQAQCNWDEVQSMRRLFAASNQGRAGSCKRSRDVGLAPILVLGGTRRRLSCSYKRRRSRERER